MTPIGPALRENISIELDARREPAYVVIGDAGRAAYIFLGIIYLTPTAKSAGYE